jgi:hypothetical protein
LDVGRRLETALAALAACPRTTTSDGKFRDRLVEQAGYALWLFVVQREACGLKDSAQVMRDYGVPNEVYARIGAIGHAGHQSDQDHRISEHRRRHSKKAAVADIIWQGQLKAD